MTPGRWYLFYDGEIILQARPGKAPVPPLSSEPPFAPAGRVLTVGAQGGTLCYACMCNAEPPLAEGWVRLNMHAALAGIDPVFASLLPKARQMVHWDTSSRFCASCGGRCQPYSPNSKRCASCGSEIFPTMAMAVLALVYRDDELLLVHAHSLKGPYYSCVAGYVEPGESLEECVRREILEETNISVEDIRYFGSEPWPFPSLLMSAFSARYAAGNIIVQQSELSDAAFFPRNALPGLPPAYTLARRLIDAWVK